MLNRRALLMTAAATPLALARPACAAPEKKSLQLAVGGKPLLYYLPLTLADRLGHFKAEGLEVTISDFQGGSKSLQALIGGSADVVTGAYDHTIQMQAKRQPITAICDLGRFPGIVLAVTKDRIADYKGPESLKGWKIGVTAPGSSTSFMVSWFLVKHGLKRDDVSYIGVGGGPSAVAAVRHGDIDAIANLDPVISQLESTGEIKVIADSRTAEGSKSVYGGGYPAAVLYTKPDFIEANPQTCQALVNAFVRTLKWLQTATPDDVAAAVPDAYLAGHPDLYKTAFTHSRTMYAPDGRLDMKAAANALEVLKTFDKAVAAAPIDLARTWNGQFVSKANGA